jgi:hypothetical protein
VEVNQVDNARSGFANPALYAAFESHGYTLYHNITAGNNGIPCTKGYSDCAGIGSLKAYALAKAL